MLIYSDLAGEQQPPAQKTKMPKPGAPSSNQQPSENIARVDDGADTLIATEGHNVRHITISWFYRSVIMRVCKI